MNATLPKRANANRTKQNSSPVKEQKANEPVLVTFESLKGNSTEELAWLGSKRHNHKKVLENIQAYLIEEPAFDVSSTLNESGGIALNFEFRCPKDWENYGIDIPFRITIEEEREGGSLGFSLGFSHSKLNSTDIEVEMNASLFLTWLAISQGARHIEFSDLILFQAKSVREKLAVAWEERAAKKKEVEEIAKLLEPIKLESVTIVLMPRYPDGSVIGPDHHLYSQLTPRSAAGASTQPTVKPYIKPRLNTGEKKSIGDSLPSVFLEPPDQMRNSYLASQKLVQLANTIKYHFSDASVIGAQSILRHPFVSLVPPDLLPGGIVSSRSLHLWRKNFSDPNRQVKPDKDQTKILNEARIATTQDAGSRYLAPFEPYEYPDAQRTNLALNAILFALGERLKLGEISVHLAFFEDFSMNEKYLELKSLSVLTEPIFKWSEEISSLPIEKDPTGNLSSVVAEFGSVRFSVSRC